MKSTWIHSYRGKKKCRCNSCEQTSMNAIKNSELKSPNTSRKLYSIRAMKVEIGWVTDYNHSLKDLYYHLSSIFFKRRPKISSTPQRIPPQFECSEWMTTFICATNCKLYDCWLPFSFRWSRWLRQYWNKMIHLPHLYYWICFDDTHTNTHTHRKYTTNTLWTLCII